HESLGQNLHVHTESDHQENGRRASPTLFGVESAIPAMATDFARRDRPYSPIIRPWRRAELQLRKCPEILCFPIIDWDFRFQRPQQLMLQFASAGCRVFYASHQFRKSGEPYQLRPVASSLWELSLLGPRFTPHNGLLDEAHATKLAESLSLLWCEHLAEGTVV